MTANITQQFLTSPGTSSGVVNLLLFSSTPSTCLFNLVIPMGRYKQYVSPAAKMRNSRRLVTFLKYKLRTLSIFSSEPGSNISQLDGATQGISTTNHSQPEAILQFKHQTVAAKTEPSSEPLKPEPPDDDVLTKEYFYEIMENFSANK